MTPFTIQTDSGKFTDYQATRKELIQILAATGYFETVADEDPPCSLRTVADLLIWYGEVRHTEGIGAGVWRVLNSPRSLN